MDKFLKDYWSIIAGVLIAVGSLAVAQYRISEVEETIDRLNSEPLKIALLEREVGRLRCDIGNVKRIIRNQAEQDC